MKYDPELIRKEFRASLSKVLKDKRNINKNLSQRIDEAIYNFIAEKVLKEINAENYKEIDDFIWQIFIDTINFVLHYGIIFREALSEFRKGFKEDLKKELKLNEEYKDLINQVLRLKRYKLEDFEMHEASEDVDA